MGIFSNSIRSRVNKNHVHDCVGYSRLHQHPAASLHYFLYSKKNTFKVLHLFLSWLSCLPDEHVSQMNMVDLARQVADTTLRSKDTQKRLWLKIAEHVIKKHEDIGKYVWHGNTSCDSQSVTDARFCSNFRAMELLRECSLLKIDDILPFFPDFVTIDHFKVVYSNVLWQVI